MPSPQIPRRCFVCTGHAKVQRSVTVELRDSFSRSRFQWGMAWAILILHDKPVPLGNMRSHGRKHVFVVCGNPDCAHNSVDVSSFPDA